MAEYLTHANELTSIANAIRTRGGTSTTLSYPTGFISAINALPTDTITIGIKTSITTLGDEFKNNIRISYINFPFITTNNATYMFANCTYLIEVRLANITELKDRAFNACSRLTTIYLNKCTKLGDYIFNGCPQLQSVYLLSTTKITITSNTFSGLASDAKIYVPSSLVNTYKSAQYWSNIASHIYAAP